MRFLTRRIRSIITPITIAIIIPQIIATPTTSIALTTALMKLVIALTRVDIMSMPIVLFLIGYKPLEHKKRIIHGQAQFIQVQYPCTREHDPMPSKSSIFER